MMYMEISIQYRHAQKEDVITIVNMLAADPLGAKRESIESSLPQSYYDAFEAIENDPNNELIVAIIDNQIVGVLQLTFIPYLTYQGGWRALIEAVRVVSEFRSQGIGRKMFQWAIHRATEKGCHMIQLTTDKQRPDALRFYESLGFNASHEGLKLYI